MLEDKGYHDDRAHHKLVHHRGSKPASEAGGNPGGGAVESDGLTQFLVVFEAVTRLLLQATEHAVGEAAWKIWPELPGWWSGLFEDGGDQG